MEASRSAVTRAVLRWYALHGRDLPWRHTRNPYHILVSEIMLQQTQVDRVIPKYHAFLKAFPSVTALAHAKASQVIKAWAGLGYNRRALFLQKTAQAVVLEHGGRFPQELETLKALPGVGDYTARAILSFAFEEPVPMMDTNHRRFYQRVLFGLSIKKDVVLLEVAEGMLPKKRAYDWNQALMDFGSAVCRSKQPVCPVCPLKTMCRAYPIILKEVPQKKKKSTKTVQFKQTDRYIRGRIIHWLREGEMLTPAILAERLAEFPNARLEAVAAGLEKDGLIRRTKKGMVLPD